MITSRLTRAGILGMTVAALTVPQPAGAGPPPAPSPAAQTLIQPEWQGRSPTSSPSAFVGASMAFDQTSDRMIMFGGIRPRGVGVPSRATWSWDGTSWERLDPATRPPARSHHDLAYDEVRHEIVMFGGRSASSRLSDTWVYAAGDWTRRPAMGPTELIDAAMAFDPHLQQVILLAVTFDAGYSVATWTWDGSGWTLLQPARSPTPQPGGELAYDPTRDALILFGGQSNETWSWTGATWQLETPLRSPPPRSYPALATIGDQVMIFGGLDDRYRNDTWILNGDAWRRLHSSPGPKGRANAAYGWDPARREVVLFGGTGNVEVLGDTWTLTLLPGR